MTQPENPTPSDRRPTLGQRLAGLRLSRKHLVALVVCIAAGVVGYYVVDLATVVAFMRDFDPWPFLFYAWISMVVAYFFKTVRFVVYLRNDISLGFWGFIRLYLVSNVIFAIASFTPGQIGDILKLEYVRAEKKINRDRLYAIFFQEKILDLLTLAAVLAFAVQVLGVEALAQVDMGVLVLVAVIAVLSLAGVAVTALMSTRVRALARHVRGLIDVGALPAAIPLTLLFWIAVTWGWREVWATHDLDFSYFATAFALSSSTLISIASMIPGAVGVSEISTAASLILLGANSDDALVASLLARAYMLTIALNGMLFLAPAGLVLWIKSAVGRVERRV